MDGSAPNSALDPEDYYFEGPYLVFTAAYHLKRGSCCKSACRHCPYGFRSQTERNCTEQKSEINNTESIL